MTNPRLDGAPAPQAGTPVRFTRPLRDRPTWVTYVQISLWAWFLYAFGATQALLRDEQGTSRAVGSLHGTAFAVGGLLGAALTAPLIKRWGRGIVLRFSAIGARVALLVYTWPGAGPTVSMAGAALAALFGTAMLISANAYLLDHQGRAGPAALTEANALASFFGLVGPLVVGLGAATVLGWRAGLWTVVVGLIVVEVWRGRQVLPYGTRSLARSEAAHGRFPSAVYWSLGVVMFFLATEFSLTLWGADLLRERCGFGGAAAAASVATLTGGMLLGRIVGSRLAERHSSEAVLKGSIVFALASFAIAWSFTFWPVVLLGMFLVGAGIGVHWPMGVARVARASGGNTDRASAAASFAGGISIAFAPFALGYLSDTIGFHTAFLLVPAFLVAALAIMWFRPVPDDVDYADAPQP